MFCRDRGRTRRTIAAGLAAAAIVASTFRVRAELPEWLRNVETAARWHDAIFQTLPTPAGPVEVRRSPADMSEALRRVPGPADTELLALRARASEETLDVAAAEAGWTAYAAASTDAGGGQLALADFYHRRLLPQKEADALAAAARADDPPADRLLRAPERRSWRLFERIFALVSAQQLPDAFAEAQYRAWIARYPQEKAPYDRLFQFLVDLDRPADAEALLTSYQRAFSADEASLLQARATLALHRGATADALAVYDQAFRPLWDAETVQAYFDLLERTHSLRAFLDRARADAAARPADLTPVARIFYYYQRTGNVGAAEQALADFEARRETATRTADELFTLARLYERTRNYNEALRYHASIYSLPGASPADVEQALASIIDTLLTAPEQPLRFGSGDLSFYHDIATLDRNPGFLNGVLSLLFNSAGLSSQYAQEQASAASYFHRGRAADLITLFEARFPNSPRRAGLNAALITTYAAYEASDAVIDHGRRYLAAFPDAPERTAMALAIADAYARKEQVTEEFASYDRLLQELAVRADRVPLGAGAAQPADGGQARPAGVRSQEYARVLDRYVARLVSRRQLREALAVYRREIDRNPNDPGLYAATAQFLEQNGVTGEVEQIYRLAIQQFPDSSWHHRLARWYIRRNQAAAFEALTRDVTRTFAGTDLARYFQAVVGRGPAVNAQLFLQLNLYAHERFPHQLVFVRNLLSAYATPATLDPAAREALLRRHWIEDEALANEFFAMLSRTNRLDAEIAGMRSAGGGTNGTNTQGGANEPNLRRLAQEHSLASRFLAEADIWRSHFESAAPIITALAAEFPGDVDLNQRTGSLQRSLSYADPHEIDAAAQTVDRLSRHNPRSLATLTTLGEIYADREQFDRAGSAWRRLPDIEPGNPAGYLESATVFWDYYQFDDALRMIAQGRAKLGNAALYAYEAGAINEGLRQGERAVDEYVRGALAAPGGRSPARSRLLTLARRPAYRALVDRASAGAATGDQPQTAAIALRIAVLEAQDRRDDLERFLLTLLDRTSSLELMADVGSQAERLGFEAVRTRSLVRQIEVMRDPLDKLQLRYALMRLYESRGDLDSARTALDAVYAENPRILGVVRQTVDYLWRHNQGREAVATLTLAASRSYPALKKQLTFEAATKSTQIADYAQARDLLKPLLAEDPFNADYLAAVAESYALAKDDRSLGDFYKSTIEAMRGAPLPADERTRRIAGLRRGLIPALARLNDHAGAVDQYIEIINRYPDDDSVLREAGRYARQHARKDQLLAYYTKTAADSPRDYRWPMLLARLETQFEDFPAAINAYATASAIRPDRADFQSERASLEERLMRFDAAIGSYTKTYELTYHDPQWMEKIAELHARQGRVDAAAKALRTALVDGRPERAETFLAVARRLDEWHMPEAARPFADQGARLAGPAGLLETSGGAAYVNVYTGLRQAAAVFDRLLAARAEAVAALGPGADGARVTNALSMRLAEMGDLVGRQYSPEEKNVFAASLEQRRAALSRSDFEALLVPLAERAGLLDLAVRWRTDLLEADRGTELHTHLTRLVDVQTSRLRFSDLAGELERFADSGARLASDARVSAAEAYRKAGDTKGELRVLAKIPIANLSERQLTREFELLLDADPQRLITLAGTGQSRIRDAAANFVVSHGSADQALEAVRARGKGLPPVWTNAYTALVGLHFARFDASTTGAFRAALGPPTVGERLKPVNRSLQLAGDVWYAYGSRFGEYLTYARQEGAGDYLAAPVERTPARSDAYVQLADFYRDTGTGPGALIEYDHAATLNSRRSDVHLRAAAILWRQGRRTDAIGRWKQALDVLAAQSGRAAVDTAPLIAALDSIGSRRVLAELRDPADKMVRAYIARNGSYRADSLLRSAFRALNDSAAGTDWLIDLGRAAPNQADTLAAIAKAAWLPDPERDRVYERLVAVGEEAVAREHGAAQAVAQSQLDGWRLLRIRSLVDTRHAASADVLLRALPDATRRAYDSDVVALETRVAAATNALDAALDRYERREDAREDAREEARPVNLGALRSAATTLRQAGDQASSRRIMEFVYTRQLDREELARPVFLGLAEIRLQQGNVPAALELLRRLTLVVGAPFDNLSASGALLDRLNRPVEALEFRRARVQAVPWDTEAHIALARTEIAAAGDRTDAIARLARIADSTNAGYAVRVEAARAFASGGGRLGRQAQTEIDWLRAPSDLTPSSADRPMFVAARVAAAERAVEPSARIDLLLAAVAVNPARAELRVPLFRAEMAGGKPAAALEAIQPVLAGSRPLTNIGLTPAARGRLAREIGEAEQQVDRLPEAVRFFTIALEGQSAAARAPIRQRLAAMNDEIGRRARNAERRPRIGEALDQPQLVRPRIPQKAAGQGGAR
jgi:tetratricopeptide (TPR) repeat protein